MAWTRIGLGLALGLALGCGGSSDDPGGKREAPPRVQTDWTACKAALEGASSVRDTDRLVTILDACRVCGDWKPILSWATPKTEGGPSSKEVDDAMVGCDAFCDGASKEKFFATLEDARGKGGTDSVWRELGKSCKGRVSATPDNRFMAPPYFALDRVARAVAGHKDGALLDKFDLPLPARSLTGAGLALVPATIVAAKVPKMVVTVTEKELRLARMPRARLAQVGVIVDLGDEPYPGKLVDKLDPAEVGEVYAVVAPPEMPAVRLVAVLKDAPPGARLAVAAPGQPPGWEQLGVLDVEIGPDGPAVTGATVREVVKQAQDAALNGTKRISLR